MDSGMVVGVGFLLGKNFFLKKSTCYQRHSMILSTRSVEASHLSKRLMWRTTSTASYFLFFCFFKQKWKMFWLPKLPTSTSGDFPKNSSNSYKTCVFFFETNGMCIAVQLHQVLASTSGGFQVMLLSQLSISAWAHVVKRQKWGVSAMGRKLPKKNPNGHAMIITFFHGWLKE